MFLLKALVLLANSLRNLIGALFLNSNIHFYFLFISCKTKFHLARKNMHTIKYVSAQTAFY